MCDFFPVFPDKQTPKHLQLELLTVSLILKIFILVTINIHLSVNRDTCLLLFCPISWAATDNLLHVKKKKNLTEGREGGAGEVNYTLVQIFL